MTTARTAAPIDATGTARRRCVLMLASLLIACALATLPTLAAPAGAAGALSADEQDYVNRANALRASLGLNPLTVDANLTDLSRAHAQVMAGSQSLHHTPDLIAGVTSRWAKLGENVGVGPNSPLVFAAFVNSPGHYANLVDPAFTHIGVGVVVDPSGLQWTTHRFMTMAPPPPPPFVPPAPVVQAPPVPAARPATVPVAPKATPASAPKVTPVLVPVTPVTDLAPVSEPAAVETPAILSPADPRRVSATLLALHAI